MKYFLIYFSILSSLTAVPRFTADHYMMNPEKYLGKEITVHVSRVHVSTRDWSDLPGYTEIDLLTAYKGESGGWIELFCLKEEVKSIARRYGTESQYKAIMGEYRAKTRPLKATLTKRNRKYVLVTKLPESTGKPLDSDKDPFEENKGDIIIEKPRIWKGKNGNEFEGILKEIHSDGTVTILNSKDFVHYTFSVELLSEEDQKLIESKLDESSKTQQN